MNIQEKAEQYTRELHKSSIDFNGSYDIAKNAYVAGYNEACNGMERDMSKEELNWFEKLPIHWKYIYYLVGGIIIGVMLHYIN